MLPSQAVDRFEVHAKQLSVLMSLHPELEPERSFSKLHAIISAMESECSAQAHSAATLFKGLRRYFEQDVLPHGVLHHISIHDFTLPAGEVPALLDRYRWRHDGARTYMQRLLRLSLEAIGSFRATLVGMESTNDVEEVRSRLSRASEELRQAMAPAIDKRDAQIVVGPGVETLLFHLDRVAMAQRRLVLGRLLPRRTDLEHVATAESDSPPSIAALSIADAPQSASGSGSVCNLPPSACPSFAPSEPEVLEGRYRLDAIVGQGDFATIYRATDTQAADAAVTVKVRHGSKASFFTRRECHFLRTLTSTGGDAHFLAKYVHGSHESARAFCVIELLGPSVFDTFVSSDPPSRQCSLLEVTCLAQQMLRALCFMQSRGVMHGDLRPATIYHVETSTAEEQSFRLADFGSASGEGDSFSRNEQKLAYRSPERILGLPCNYPTEIWSLGCTLCEVCLHRQIFLGKSEAAVLATHRAYLGMQPEELLTAPEAKSFFDDEGRIYHVDSNGSYILTPHTCPLRPELEEVWTPSVASGPLFDEIILMLTQEAHGRPSPHECLQRLL